MSTLPLVDERPCFCAYEPTPVTCPRHGAFPGGEMYNRPRRAPVSITGHDPIPDGRTGPFMRKPHLKMESSPRVFVLAFDTRCTACRREG